MLLLRVRKELVAAAEEDRLKEGEAEGRLKEGEEVAPLMEEEEFPLPQLRVETEGWARALLEVLL